MESAEPVDEPLRVKTSKAIVVADHSHRVIHPISQLMISIETTDPVEFFTFASPVPIALSVVAPVPVAVLRRSHGRRGKPRRERKRTRDHQRERNLLQAEFSCPTTGFSTRSGYRPLRASELRCA